MSQSESTLRGSGATLAAAAQIHGTGEMAERVRSFDWAASPLGDIHTWSETLICAVNMILAAPVPMQLFWGSDFTILYNDALVPLLTDKHPFALGQPAERCWSEAWGTVGPQMAGVRQTGRPLQFDESLVPVARNGAIEDVYWKYSYSAIRARSGEIEGVLDVAEDVTAFVVARQRLAASEARANRILQSIGDAVVVTDADDKVTVMNPVAEQLTGWPMDEARGLPLATIFRVINESTREPVENPAAGARRVGAAVALANHSLLLHRSGAEIHIDDSAAPIVDDHGNTAGIVLVFRDIEERRRAEITRDGLTAQLKQILEGTKDGIAMVDRNWRYTYFNAAGREIASAPDDVLGQNIWEAFPGMVYEGSPYVYHQERAMYENLPGEFTAEYPQLNLSLQVLVRPVPDGIVTLFRDISEQKRALNALIRSEKLAAVGRLASSIAHEINNPLEAVTNLLYLLRGESTPTKDRAAYLQAAEQELRRVSAIANQTLRFHKHSNKPTQVRLDELVGSSISVYQGRLANSGIHVERRDRVTRPVQGFDGELRQVLNNLIANAIDAMPEGGRLLLRTREATCLKTGRQGVAVSVADTGSGISPVLRKKIFEPFFTTKESRGTGLGLWVSAEIIERHHGKLLLRSSQVPGKSGSVFALFLPFDLVPEALNRGVGTQAAES